MPLEGNEAQILRLFPPGRRRRIQRYLIENPEIDSPRHQRGQLTFELFREGPFMEVSTSGIVWKAEKLPDIDMERRYEPEGLNP